MNYIQTLMALIFFHALADYPLQGDFLAKAKNRRTAIPGINSWVCLFFHAVIHSGFVLFVTGSVALALSELVSHFVIDSMKNENVISFNVDQALHVLCKIAYVVILMQWAQ